MPYLNKDMAIGCCTRLLMSLGRLQPDDSQPNPAIEFNRLKKDGQLDCLSDEEYTSALHATNELSHVIWKNDREMSTSALLYTTLREAHLSEVQARLVAKVVTMAYQQNYGLDDPYVPLPYDFPHIEPHASTSAKKADRRRSDIPLATMSARAIYAELDRTVYGQKDAKRAMAALLWHHAHGNSHYLLMAGPTGCGKSYLVEAASRLCDDFVYVDGSQLTAEGWKGEVKFSNIFQGLTRRQAERSIVVIDEADKLFEPATSSEGENVSYRIQNELLKLMDGGRVKTKLKDGMEEIETGRICYVFMGSFETLLREKSRHRHTNGIGFGGEVRSVADATYEDEITSDDLVEHAGVRREVAGRINAMVQLRPLLVQLRPLYVDDYLDILADPARSPLPGLERKYGHPISLSDEERRALAQGAADSGLGMRGIVSQLTRRLDAELFELDDAAEGGKADGPAAGGDSEAANPEPTATATAATTDEKRPAAAPQHAADEPATADTPSGSLDGDEASPDGTGGSEGK